MQNNRTVKCECGRQAKLVDLGDRKAWNCEVCNAWVDANPTSPTHAPLGKLADSKMQYWKTRARDSFNMLWVPVANAATNKADKKGIRAKAFKWLANELNMDTSALHFDQMTVEQCQRVYALCSIQDENFFRR